MNQIEKMAYDFGRELARQTKTAAPSDEYIEAAMQRESPILHRVGQHAGIGAGAGALGGALLGSRFRTEVNGRPGGRGLTMAVGAGLGALLGGLIGTSSGTYHGSYDAGIRAGASGNPNDNATARALLLGGLPGVALAERGRTHGAQYRNRQG